MSDFNRTKHWFEQNITLFGKPYTLDDDQARAVFDTHKNTLVTARAGSGKTRVIVAKIAYLVATKQARLSEIKAFMFNRTAAAEVNERIGAVAIGGVSLRQLNGDKEIRVASTFHKFALDTVKAAGERPELISEAEQGGIIRQSVARILQEQHRRLSPSEQAETLRLVSSFITRAGQKYSGEQGLPMLCQDLSAYCTQHQNDPDYQSKIWLHQLALAVYEDYLLQLNYPKLDFNILMARATRILEAANQNHPSPSLQNHPNQASKRTDQATLPVASQNYLARLKYILVDEYQDFSYLFFSIIQALRGVCPAAHLFVVGDDWQAINRFAGSDVDYFLNFAKYFPDDVINIPLMTNYRSDRKIVENANRYMLKHYNPKAKRAIPFNKTAGKIKRIYYPEVRFDATDLAEDQLGDARFQLALSHACGGAPGNYATAARLLKTVYKIAKRHRKEQILFLHRHNFTSFQNVSLDNFAQALQTLLVQQNILTPAQTEQNLRFLTMHKSKGLESDVVVLLELDREMVLSPHPHATTFTIFGDTRTAETADQHRLLYVALTRAKHKLYLVSKDKKFLA